MLPMCITVLSRWPASAVYVVGLRDLTQSRKLRCSDGGIGQSLLVSGGNFIAQKFSRAGLPARPRQPLLPTQPSVPSKRMQHAARLDQHLDAVGVAVAEVEFDRRRGHRVLRDFALALDLDRAAGSAELATCAVSSRCAPQSASMPPE